MYIYICFDTAGEPYRKEWFQFRLRKWKLHALRVRAVLVLRLLILGLGESTVKSPSKAHLIPGTYVCTYIDANFLGKYYWFGGFYFYSNCGNIYGILVWAEDITGAVVQRVVRRGNKWRGAVWTPPC